MSTSRTVVRTAGLLMGISVFSRLAGFIREQAIAAQFGTSSATDAYVVALTIVNLLYLVLGGALATVFIPLFTQRLADFQGGAGGGSPWRLASATFNLAALTLGLIALLGMLTAPLLVQLVAPGFSPETAALTTRLTRIMFPITLLAAGSMLVGGLLNALQHFTLPALSSVVFSLTVTAAVFTFGRSWGIAGLALGTVVATLCQVLVQLPALRGRGVRYHPVLDLGSPDMQRLLHLMGPVILGNLVAQAYALIERFLASGLSTGSISALNFANRLMLLPFNLFSLAITTAIFPTLSRQAAAGDHRQLGQTTALGLRLNGLLTLPAAAGMLALAGPIVRLVYQRGAFDFQSSAMTTAALSFYLLGLFALGGFTILSRAFYALQDTRTPVLISLLSVAANLALGLLLVGPLQHAGLALAAAAASNLNLLLAWLVLQRRLPGLGADQLLPPLGRLLAAALLMAGIVWLGNQGMEAALAGLAGGSGHLPLGWQLLQVGTAALAGLLVYWLLVKWLRADEETRQLVAGWWRERRHKPGTGRS